MQPDLYKKAPERSDDPFLALCILASEERWCWKLCCTTCGHHHFRAAFKQLADGITPLSEDWQVSRSGSARLTVPVPRSFDELQVERIIEVCLRANLTRVAEQCRFPSWLGYLGLVLWHTGGWHAPGVPRFRELSINWATQLMQLLPQESESTQFLERFASGEFCLAPENLEQVEQDFVKYRIDEAIKFNAGTEHLLGR